jgi:hypothetical protein
MGKKSRSVSGMNIRGHTVFPRAQEQLFGLKYFFLRYPVRTGMRIRIRDPGIFLTLDPGDPQHCFVGILKATKGKIEILW